MPLEPPSLAELQSRFQAAVVQGDDDVLSLIPSNSRTSNAVLLGVYRHAYVARLFEVVRNAYPLLARTIGDEAFAAMARRYVALTPSHHANARWYAVSVPEFIAQHFSAQPELGEIAQIERQLDLAFDAADAPLLDLTTLAQYPPQAWGGLIFVPHPSVAVLEMRTNAFDLWRALRDEDASPSVQVLAEPQALLVWRREDRPVVRRLEAVERILLAEAMSGKSFGVLAETAAIYDDPKSAALRVAQALNRWLAEGLISLAMTGSQRPGRVVVQSGQPLRDRFNHDINSRSG